jgi:hypothetical protein
LTTGCPELDVGVQGLANVRRCTPSLAPHLRCNLGFAGGMQRSLVGRDTANGKVERQTGEQIYASVEANHTLAS